MDRGHERTEQIINKIGDRLRAEYTHAGKELEETINDYFKRFDLKDKKWQEWVKDGTHTQDEYDAWRTQQIMQGKRWKALKDQIAEDMLNTNQTARDITESYMPEVYQINHNYGLYQIEVGNGYQLPSSLTLYNRDAIARILKDDPDLMPMGKTVLGEIARGKAKRWERQKIQSVAIQGILQGKSNVRIAKDIAKDLANGDFKASMRYARTMSTNAQNGGRYGAYRRLERNGVPITLQWEATLDQRTRTSHRYMHGQRRDVNQPFEVDGVEILYPAWMGVGDYKVPTDQIWNCRCTLLAFVKGFEHDALKTSERMEDLPFEEWLDAKPKPEPITKQRDIGEAMRMRHIRRYGGNGNGIKDTPQPRKELTFSEKVNQILEKAKNSAQGITTKDIREVGKVFAEEVNNHLSTLQENLKKAKERYERIDKQIHEYYDEEDLLIKMQNGEIDFTKHGFSSLQSVVDRYEYIRKKETSLYSSGELDDAYDKYWNAQIALNSTKSHRLWLKNKIGEVRPVGLGEYEGKKIKQHLSNSRSPMRKIVEQAYDHYPTEWVQHSVNMNNLSVKKADRGFYWDFYQQIAISGNGNERSMETAIHELGHRFERAVPHILEQEQEFYKQRTDGENLEWLGGGYGKNEKTRRDKFVSPYMGKDYGGGSFELVSMGFQYAYAEPAQLAKDPDMQEWILGMLLSL